MASTNTRVDYIIVGQGLAGSAVAVQLLLRKKKIFVIDWPAGNVSTSVAAGLFNPLTGKKIVRTWKADIIFPYLHAYYRQVEQMAGANFFAPMPIYRPFLSVEEQNEWMAASADPRWADFIEKIITKPSYLEQVNDPFGGILLRNSGYINTTAYIFALRNLFVKRNSFSEEIFDDSLLSFDSGTARYRDVVAKYILFCDGVALNKSRLFSWLPIRQLKGETLTIQASLPGGMIPNRGVYVVPAEEKNVWRVGATYEHGEFEAGITEKGRNELEYKLTELIAVPYKVIGHHWGVRPTTPDRRPIMGSHPEWPLAVAFNGFGTKGVSLTPYFSKVLVDWLEGDGDLHKEVDINRYKSLYWRSP